MNMDVRYGLLVCCHIIYSTLVVIRNILNFAKRLVGKWIYSDDIDREICIVSKSVKHFKKVPRHIVILLGNEAISYKDMANIVLWCMAAGITYITLYDHDGLLQEDEYTICKAVEKRSKVHGRNIVWGKGSIANGTILHNGVQNGKTSIPKVQVKILSLNDCKEAFLKVTKSLCLSARNSEITSNDISQDLINEMLVEETGLPEPELALYCGEVCCTYGFLPWHIRVTEFLKLSTHHNITAREFINLLESYGKCEQRFGK